MGKTEIEKTIKAATELVIGFMILGFVIAYFTFWWIARWPIIIAIDERLDSRVERLEDYRRKWEIRNPKYDNPDFELMQKEWDER